LIWRPSCWLAKAATIRVPSVGFALATSTISRSTASTTARRAAFGRRFGVR
jgi:hypothetical protein